MPLDAAAAVLLNSIRAAARPPLGEMSLEDARLSTDQAAAVAGFEPPSDVQVEDEWVEGTHHAFRCRVYRPSGIEGVSPCILFFHGGGWMVGSLASHDALCRRLAREVGSVLVAVDYRLAPEHPFPGAVDDALTAARWLLQESGRLGIDRGRFALCGDSAGGNLAAVVALHSGESGMPAFCGQVLLYPVTDMTEQRPSYGKYKAHLLTDASMATFIDRYAPNLADRRDWRASPLLAPHLERTPPTVVYTAEFDVLYDEGVEFVRRLKRAGVDATHREVLGQMHAFLSFGKLIPAAEDVLRHIVVDLKTWLKQVGP